MLFKVFAVAFAGALVTSFAAVGEEVADARLRLKAVVVAQDLSQRPVAKRRIRLTREDAPGRTEVVTTGFDGAAEVTLVAGRWRVSVEEPVLLDGSSLRWDLPVTLPAGATTTLELANDNATITAAAATPAGATAEGEVYERVRSGVFKVIGENRQGTGFLVDERGLVLTNHHVIRDSERLAVLVGEARKHEAVLLASDEVHDLAVLRVHADTVAGCAVLPLAEDAPERPPTATGARVLAIGNPFTTQAILTSGIVSKVEEGALYSDVNVNTGNSGGPLLDGGGRVIAVTTFGVGSGARSVAGAVRIYLAAPLLAAARGQLEATEPPLPRPLPVESTFRFPTAELRRLASARPYRSSDYHLEAGKMDVQILTPVVAAAIELDEERQTMERRRSQHRGEPPAAEVTGELYAWRRYSGAYRPVVTVFAVPEVYVTPGSDFFAQMAGPRVERAYRFKADFKRMVLRRDGAEVEPIQAGRVRRQVSSDGAGTRLHDTCAFGRYEYPPEAFRPGASVTLEIWEEGGDRPVVRAVKPELVQRIWADFEPYWRAQAAR